MKLARLGPAGAEVPVLLTDDGAFDLRPVIASMGASEVPQDPAAVTDRETIPTSGESVAHYLSPAVLTAISEAAREGSLPQLQNAHGARIGAPVPRPGSVLCIGQNYAAHAAEAGAQPPEVPILFFKPANTVTGPNDAVAIPRNSIKTDWEVELGVVIGSRALYLDSPAQAREHIAGFVTVNDFSERDFQLAVSGGQWSKGKGAPGFAPIGPHLVTADEVDPNNLRLRSWVNGEPRQNSSTSDMIFDVDHIVWHLSQYMALDPGDVICTGTPEGVALSGRFSYLQAGDVVEVEIDGLGRQRTEMTQA